MPKIANRDFSAGWIPSDSQYTPRSNGLIRMANVCIDQKGAITLRVSPTVTYFATGIQNFLRFGNSNCIKYFSFVGIPLGSSTLEKLRYIITAGGFLWRANTPQLIPPSFNANDSFNAIQSGMATSPIPNFLAAMGQVFITGTPAISGATTFKDDGVVTRKWGIEAIGPLNTVSGFTVAIYKGAKKAVTATFVGTTAGTGGTVPFSSTTQVDMQITNPSTTVTFTQSISTNLNSLLYSEAGSPLDTTTDVGNPNDTFIFPLSATAGRSVLLTLTDSGGKTYTFNFTANINGLNTPLTCLRSDFSGSADWGNIVSWNITVTSPAGVSGDLYTIYNPNPSYTDSLFGFIGGSKSQLKSNADTINNPYQVALRVGYLSSDGNYNGLSILSDISTTVPGGGPFSGSLSYQYNSYIYVVTPASLPGGLDTQLNTFWYYIRGGTLEQYFLAGIIGLNTNLIISGPDTTLANINETYLDSLEPLSSINEVILDVIGPVNGRLLLITPTYVYFTDVLNAEVIDANATVRLGQAVTDFNLFIKKVSNQVVNVGTSSEVYEITGDLSLQQDGTYNIVVTHLGQEVNPPVSSAACVYDSILFFHSKDGIRELSGSNSQIISPDLIDLFRQDNINGLDNVGLIGGGGSSASLVAGRQKLFFSVESDNASNAGIDRAIYEYDFITKTWNERLFAFSTAPTTWFTDKDGVTIATCPDGFCRYYESSYNVNYNDGQAGNYLIKTPLFDDGNPNVRKTIETLILNIDTTGVDITVQLYSENGIGASYTVHINGFGRIAIDVSGDALTNSCRYGIIITGFNGAFSDIFFTDWSLSYEPRSELRNSYIILPTNFSTSAPKKLSTLSFVINTFGNDVLFTPKVDGITISQGPRATLNTTEKKTVIFFFTGPVFGTDFSGFFEAASITDTDTRPSFELEIDAGEVFLKPTNLETLPDPKIFDQAGPFVLDRRGKLLSVRTRMMGYKNGTTGTFVVECKVFLDEVNVFTFDTTVQIGIDTTYEFMQLPKTLLGNVLRLEYTSSDVTIPFVRWNSRIKVDFSGNDTDNTWISEEDEKQ